MLDKKITEKYLNVLMDFSKYLVSTKSLLPASRKSYLSIYFCKLINELRQHLKIIKTSNLNTTISIEPNILFPFNNIKTKKRKFHISLGGKIVITNSIITEQSLSVNIILEHTDKCNPIPENWKMYPVDTGFHIIRRFHFDYDISNDDNLKPKFHLQYGGNFEQKYFDLGNNIYYKLCNPLDTPRLPQQPYDIIMLLDFIVREFSLNCKIINEARWNELVINSETIWLEPYYRSLLDRLSDSKRSQPLHRIN
ncbi:hypothetical protein JG663_15125 [Vibrio cholerae]|uniref:hypothetical protein n=2 Tax=Vibrio cholerae TaxID=666 RepID=UPI0018F05F1E|nr:hypothetical protein [Vibrio cholerae]MBJ6881083.1 hypothetical protein [Vibrio cholerae]MBJ6884696.1 hypothetical protein [Vibrio cholerae]MBJ6892229.1 hypothetical protein [Vibrio cholerae]MBJ6926224.1 hypothetical protein [Vibrio cholerae]MED7815567.1 hypothetical protein [Vibrio cholerae]